MPKLLTAAVVVLWACWVQAALAGEPGPILAEDFDSTWQAGRWTFSSGPEFPGAAGSFSRSVDAGFAGDHGGRLAFDFSGGGNYVSAILSLPDCPDISAVRLRLLKPTRNRLTFRYTDGSGQTLQRPFWAPDGRWVDVLIPCSGWAIHWGGANDGVPQGPPRQIAFLIENPGQKTGALLIDDIRLVPGIPVEGAGMVTCDYVAAAFGQDAGWWLSGSGDTAGSALTGRKLTCDFTRGAQWVGVTPQESSLLGDPVELRLRMRGGGAGHPVRLRIATHFMTFEKTVGTIEGDGETDLVAEAPPGEGWQWYGGENDGRRHGPLRIMGIFFDAAGLTDTAEVELLDIRVKTRCAPDRCCVLMADYEESPDGGAFVATVRSLLPGPASGTLAYTIRDWAGSELAAGSEEVALAPGAVPESVRVALPEGEHEFLEAEFVLDVPDQLVPSASACYVAPVQSQADAVLDPASPFGMGLYLYRYAGSPAGLAEMDRAAAMGAAAGVKWTREEFNWGRIERERGRPDWTFYDEMVASAGRHCISIYGLLAYWAPWADAYTDEGIADYCRFAGAAAARYRDDIRYWEVWNEPNIFFWQGPRDMYAELLTAAYAAIKEANPDAQVLGCSTAGIDLGFIRRTMELGAPFDAVTIHPYRAYLDDAAFVRELREAADAARLPDGSVRPMWITEMGWATHTPHNAAAEGFSVTSQREQAQLLARAYIGAMASGVTASTSWYDFRNDGTDPFNFEHNLGVVTRDFRPKPACRAYATLTRMLKGRTDCAEVDLGEDVIAHRFTTEAGLRPVLAAWAVRDDTQVQLPWDGPATVTDLMGGAEPARPAGGALTLRLRVGSPVFVSPATP